jgi:tetratricopeptide (TPR) repeat protein
MKRNALTVFVLLPLLLLSCGAFWQSDTARGINAARTGEYAAAVRALEAAMPASNDPVLVESLYHAWIYQGEYARAKDRFEAWATARPTSGPIRLAAGRVNALIGNYDAALKHLDAVLSAPDVGVAASFEKAKVLEARGKLREADALFDKIVEDSLSQRPTTDAAEKARRQRNLIYVAGSLDALEKVQEAADVYKTITNADPQNVQAWVARGDLFSRKFDETEAIANYRGALKVDPKNPDAQLGLSKNLEGTEPEKAAEALKEAMTSNPKLPAGHLLEASHQIENEAYDKAMESVNKALEVNPQSPEAFSVAATVGFLKGDTAGFNNYRDKVLAINPQYSKLYYTLADSAVSVRQYRQAVGFAREALKLNPKDWDSMTLLGINLQRIGEEFEGTDVLESAFAGDPYNKAAGNTLTLLDNFRRGDFERIRTEHFEVKLHKKESAALQPYVKDLLEKAYTNLSAKYGYTPKGPLQFEMFPDHADFEVRAIGLTGLGALGVCFGNLFVMDSPSSRELDHFNWGSTLWHEFTHIITLQMTDNKVPRWFSEGLSVFEERKAYPGWGDDMKLDTLKAFKAKRFLPVADLNDGFMHQKYPGQILVSYYQASMVSEYIDSKWGFAAIRNMLGLYKNGKTTEQVFKEALNVSTTDFDTQFTAWMNQRAGAFDPAQYGKLLNEGVAALEAGDADKAIATLKQAVALFPEYSDENNAYEPLAEAYLKKNDKGAAIDTLKQYLNWSETAFSSYVKLSDLLAERGDKAGAAKTLEGAMYVRPMDLQGHAKLGTLLLDLKQYSGAAREYETMIALKTPDRATAYYVLAQAYLGMGDKAKAKKAVINSLDIAPTYGPAGQLLLEITK